jgi:ribulose-phosphate 3-epimerase
MTNFLLSSSILSADFTRLSEQIKAAEDGGVDWIHIDVMDGHFVPNITMGPFIVETCRRITELPLDVHLMITKPENHIEAFASAGANRISVHIEDNPSIYRTLQELRRLDVHPAIVLNPGTPAKAIESVIPLIDMALVMTVNPGFSGQQFIPDMVAKVAEVRQLFTAQGSDALIQVDGGITADNISQVCRAGANVIVAATSIFKFPGGIQGGIQALRNAVLH